RQGAVPHPALGSDRLEGISHLLDRPRPHDVEEVDQLGLAPEILRERKDLALFPKLLLYPIPDVDFGPAEAIDRLLRVADEEELGAIDPPAERERDVRLGAICILELVDDEDPVPSPDRVQGGVTVRPGEQVESLENERVEVLDVLLPLVFRPAEQCRPGQLVECGASFETDLVACVEVGGQLQPFDIEAVTTLRAPALVP